MAPSHRLVQASEEALKLAISIEAEAFARSYRWLEEHLPATFLKEVTPETKAIIARHLLSFQIQNRFCQIHLGPVEIVLCLDSPEADLKILKHYTHFAIRYYRGFVSNAPPPGEKTGALRVAILHLQEAPADKKLEPEKREELLKLINKSSLKDAEAFLHTLPAPFFRSLTSERLVLALEVFSRAKTSDICQIELKKNEDWQSKGSPSLQLVLAWKNGPKAGFLYELARMIHAHGLSLRKVTAAYTDPYTTENVLVLSIGLHGMKGGAAWEEANIADFIRELHLIKFVKTNDLVDHAFIKPKLLNGNDAHLVHTFASFVHQCLLLCDPHLFSLENTYEALCRHPELTVQLCKTFEARFHPEKHRLQTYREMAEKLLELISKLDTGQAANDRRRKIILKQTLCFIECTLKTNFYCQIKSAFSFRLHPKYLDEIPFDRKEKFPELPFGIFFIRGATWLGFHIRFKDLARGGVRTITPDRFETFEQERDNLFSEAYNLSYTQQKKNKDIPEGGAKTAILLSPFEVFAKEEEIYKQEMELEGVSSAVLEQKIKHYRREHKLSYLFASQRAFIESFMTLINCNEEGHLLASALVDYYLRPEYIYLGPDENMLNEMIVWIANYAVSCGYKPGHSFMSSKPGAGINHKQYGVTSFGVNVYLHQTLLSLGIDPTKDPFTIKVSGGPDGDVAGNELHILATRYPKTAKLLALTDVSGTIFDPQGLDWQEIDLLFKEGKPLRHYPPEKLHSGGFLLDLSNKREKNAYAYETLCWRKKETKLVEEWLSGSEMNHLYRHNVHQTVSDVFVPGGGRPKTLNESNYETFLTEQGTPTSRAIVEGANLYLTPDARRALEKLGVIVLKDSSCNKGGVICSSFEVLAGLCLSEEEFLKEKESYVKEVLEIIRKAAMNEANLLLETQRKTGAFFTDLSEQISERINLYKYQLLEAFETMPLTNDRKDPLVRCLFLYCPPLLRKKYPERILALPEIHKKAIVAVFLAAHLVYTRGLDWAPSVTDILPIIAEDPQIIGEG